MMWSGTTALRKGNYLSQLQFYSLQMSMELSAPKCFIKFKQDENRERLVHNILIVFCFFFCLKQAVEWLRAGETGPLGTRAV